MFYEKKKTRPGNQPQPYTAPSEKCEWGCQTKWRATMVRDQLNWILINDRWDYNNK